jgi:hypothetical protein
MPHINIHHLGANSKAKWAKFLNYGGGGSHHKLRRLVAGFKLRRPGFEPESGHVGFVVDKVALG